MKISTLIIVFLLPLIVVSQDLIPLSNPNYRLHPSSMDQTEVFITRNPFNENILFSACNTLSFIPFFVSEGIYVTEDGGDHWRGNDTCTGNPVAFHGGDPGIAIDLNGTFIITRLGRSPFSGLYSHYSNDNGLTWSQQIAISTDDLERASLATGPNTSSVYPGRTYAVWVRFAYPYPLMFARTDNGAQSWSAPVAVNNPPDRSAGGDIAVGVNGELYACWAGVTQTSPFKEIHTGFAKSVNGGDSWNVQEIAYPVNGITGQLSGKNNIRVNGLPAIAVDTTGGPYNGWIYIVTGEKDLAPAGSDPDIILHRSEDGGNTWSAGIRVNQDPLSNGRSQYFPSIEIDGTGAIDILFYDDRHTTLDSAGVVLARSTDGGDSWKEYLVSTHNFRPEPIGGLGQGYQGDNIDLTSAGGKIWPVWMDNSTGIYQVWTAPADISSLGITEKTNPDFILEQNNPNPFKNGTEINFNILKKGEACLEIFDFSGKKIKTVFRRKFSPGKVKVEITGDEFSPGIYFYRLISGNSSETMKMIRIP